MLLHADEAGSPAQLAPGGDRGSRLCEIDQRIAGDRARPLVESLDGLGRYLVAGGEQRHRAGGEGSDEESARVDRDARSSQVPPGSTVDQMRLAKAPRFFGEDLGHLVD